MWWDLSGKSFVRMRQEGPPRWFGCGLAAFSRTQRAEARSTPEAASRRPVRSARHIQSMSHQIRCVGAVGHIEIARDQRDIIRPSTAHAARRGVAPFYQPWQVELGVFRGCPRSQIEFGNALVGETEFRVIRVVDVEAVVPTALQLERTCASSARRLTQAPLHLRSLKTGTLDEDAGLRLRLQFKLQLPLFL